MALSYDDQLVVINPSSVFLFRTTIMFRAVSINLRPVCEISNETFCYTVTASSLCFDFQNNNSISNLRR
jgi:hypothetical protein